MTRRTLLGAALALAACGGAPPSPPPSPAPPADEPRPEPPRDDAQPPRQQRSATPLPAPRVLKLENGMTAAVTQAAPGHDALVQLGFFAGGVFMAPGAAELAMEVLVEDADASQGRPALTQAIAQLGGTLSIRMGPATSWLDVRIPAAAWEQAVVAVRRALEAPAQSRHQIERIRARTVAERSAWIRRDPTAAMAQLLLLGESGAASYMHALLDRDPSEVNLFQARLHRPERAVLMIETPDDPARTAQALARSGSTALGAWQPPPAPSGAVPTLDRKFAPGLYWCANPAPKGRADDTTHIALVLFLPQPGQPIAADMLLLHVCLTLDGTGGRLEKLQQDAGLGHVRWKSSVANTADATAIVLAADVAAADVQPLWRTLERARASLRDLPPTSSEIAIAVRRAPLTARLAMLDEGARLRLQAKLLLQGLSWANVEQRLAMFADLPSPDLRAATAAFLELPVALVAVGGAIPDDATDVKRFELLPGTDAEPPPAASRTAPAPATGTAWLDRAAAAAGGLARLRRLQGWDSDARVTNDQTAPLTETCRWRADGSLQRTREILGQNIRTTLAGDAWSETLGDVTKSLNSREAALLRRELLRHPLALLAAHARGELTFRPIAQRDAGDRDVMVLEAVGDRFDRLRIHVDTGSHLIRVVESWETLPDGTVMHLQDRWSDYRTTAGLRAPFHRLTTQDDGQNRVETVFTRWVPEIGLP